MIQRLPLVLLAIVIGFAAVPATTSARDRHDDYRDYSKDLKNDLNALQNHYDQVKDRVKNLGGGDRRLWGSLRDIKSNIDGIYDDANRGRYDGLRYRIQRSHEDLRRLQDQMESNNKRHGGYYRPY